MSEEQKHSFTTEPGDFLIVHVIDCARTFIAEVTRSSRLRMKIQEKGRLANLKHSEVTISRRRTASLQRDILNGTTTFLEEQERKGRQIVSGLRSLGVADSKLQAILPATILA